MLNEVIEILGSIKNSTIVDATFGAGGYSRAILQNGCSNLLAFDQDISTEKYFLNLLNEYPNKISFINDNFKRMSNYIEEEVDGFVFDIGVSSMQIDQAERGFSFNKDGALDMRMDKSTTTTAADIVNTYEEKKLADIIFQYGGEKKSRQIAKQIVKERAVKPFTSTIELANAVTRAAPRYNDDIHPATRTFQAIRIEVNKELEALSQGLSEATAKIKKGGKILVVTFHSLEDSIVKQHFLNICGFTPNNNRHMPDFINIPNEPKFELLTKKALTPSNQELLKNPRARSAKLRAVRRVS